ncbi:MAG: hypothetical protein A2W22_01100 [Candidatus Levybacteria bacterium RBG_16_35_11]|nr:MAG: hypothetical protein A2W22_01100 [Candidatus Levybacteria bacterium RBG_16_35_11]
MVDVDWDYIYPGKKPVCMVGAGFQKAVLHEELKLPSTEDIIEKTVESQGEQFPILSILFDKKISPRCDLNYIWKNINRLSSLLANYYSKIELNYSLLNNKIIEVINYYKKCNQPPHTIIWVVLGLELKKMLAYQYNSTKINGESSFKKCAIGNLKEIISKSEKITWISLNYDIVLEQMLVYAIYNQKKFNHSFGEVKYSFEQLFGNLNIVDFKHLIIKPHGSLNVVFKTENQNSNDKIHSLCFKEDDDYFATFDWNEFGYDKNNQNLEKRPWLIGYLPDEMKDELNSRACFSDLAHDLCKWNMASTSFALEYASSIFILGYSMPQEDEWIWARFRNIRKKNKNIFVASKCSSERIVKEFKRNGFENVNIINDGKI